ncbi:hypothetical protein P4S72_15780 [Vibrio sp. PP-XX7]
MVHLPVMTCRFSIRCGVKKEHLHTRDAAGLFDVSHMGQLYLKGADAAADA